ncbi:NAD(P)H-binding protein [Chryseolinea lacunae]|uniref:NAD(P)H-binding protein n=1 Tax=Chryseolinea lacunae TaxID=2801331 RepID=A0ABS1L1I0_9BACT|nr:NAD(P)H-binding protein [Chryseolinea lacunae]MBL0745504.1 NAD(P)H-binding protein [Chryseolinea lacunae]
MKITVTGSLGHISLPLTQTLVQQGHAVTVISSNPEKQKDIEALGATAAIGSLEDIDFLTAAFTGADAVYTMIPPKNYFDHSLDLVAFYNQVARNYAQAIKESGVTRVVHLSSIGAHLDKGTGLILGHHGVERILDTLSDVAITFMRPTAFFYNLFAFLKPIKNTGTMAANYGADDTVSWVSPLDIAVEVADEIATPLVGRKVRYVASDELTCNEVARILGEAIGKPDLKWTVISDEQMLSGFHAIGMGPKIAADFVALNASMHRGELFNDYNLNRPVLGRVKLTDFAKEFAAAFNQ